LTYAQYAKYIKMFRPIYS